MDSWLLNTVQNFISTVVNSVLSNTGITVILTLVITYLSTSISNAIKKQRLVVATYSMLINISMNESKIFRLFLKESVEEEILVLPPSTTLYTSSLFELLQIAEMDKHAHFAILDTCERYNLIRYTQKKYTKLQARDLMETFQDDYQHLNAELDKVSHRSWFYYWWIECKNLFSICCKATYNNVD